MGEIKIKYYTPFKEITHREEDFMPPNCERLADLINLLNQKYNFQFDKKLIDQKTGRIKSGLTIFVSGKKADLEHPLKDGDEVLFLGPIAGG